MIKQAIFIKSAAARIGWLEDDIKEICFVGRSNVGKSTFINAICNQNKLAKVSSSPGKTRLLNFFDINNGEFRIVDAPGYGYAKVNLNMKREFALMMDEYLTERDNLKAICMLVDLRHKPTKDDKEMYAFFKNIGIKVLLIGTKLDKLKRNEIKKNEQMIHNELGFDSENDLFLKVSNLNKTNIEKVYDLIISILGE